MTRRDKRQAKEGGARAEKGVREEPERRPGEAGGNRSTGDPEKQEEEHEEKEEKEKRKGDGKHKCEKQYDGE